MKEYFESDFSDEISSADTSDIDAANPNINASLPENLPEYDSLDALRIHEIIETTTVAIDTPELMGMLALSTIQFTGDKQQQKTEFFKKEPYLTNGDIQITPKDAAKLIRVIKRRRQTKH